jgi:Rod binding domain-containing protein
MDLGKLILNQPVSRPRVLDKTAGCQNVNETRKEKFAKDFESVFIHKLLDEMKNSIGNWDEEKDSGTEQIDGIFWMKLAEDLADKGGFGMWKDIYQQISQLQQEGQRTVSLDENL